MRYAAAVLLTVVFTLAVAVPPARSAEDGKATAAPAAAAPAAAPRGFQGAGPLLGIGEDPGAPPYKVRWRYKAGAEDRVGIEGQPVIAGGRVYVADQDGVLHAIDLATGQAAWKFTTPDGFGTTPLVYDGKVFIGDMVGKFHAVSVETGKAVWSFDAQSPIHSPANAEGGKVVFGTDGAEVYCLAAADGKQLWKGASGDRVNGSPAIGDGLAFVSGCDAQLRGFDLATGEEKFAVDLGALAPGSAAHAKDRVVVGTDNGRVVCVSADGKRALWTYEGIGNQAMVFASPAVAVADGVAVVGARDRQVHGIDLATGKGLWTFKARGDVDASPVIAGGRVFAASRDRKLYVLDLKTGAKQWEFTLGRGVEGGLAVASGVIVIADSAGNVVCLE